MGYFFLNGWIFPGESNDFRRVCGCRPFTFSVVEDNGLELGRVLRRRVKIGLRLAGSHYNNSEPAVSFMAWFRLLCHRAKPRLTYLSLQTALLPLFLQPPCLCQFNTRIIPLLPHLPSNFASQIGPFQIHWFHSRKFHKYKFPRLAANCCFHRSIVRLITG